MPDEPCRRPLYRVIAPHDDRSVCSPRPLVELLAIEATPPGDALAADTHQVLALVGELCSYSTSILSPILAELSTTTTDLVLDLGGVTFVDASALTLLTDLGAQIDANGGTLVLHRASPCVRRLLVIAGMDDLLRRRPVAAASAADGAGP